VQELLREDAGLHFAVPRPRELRHEAVDVRLLVVREVLRREGAEVVLGQLRALAGPRRRRPASSTALRVELADELRASGLTNLDLDDVLSRNRQVTQRISRWPYEYDYHGIVYASRFNAGARPGLSSKERSRRSRSRTVDPSG